MKPHVESLPFEKRMALYASLKRCVGGQERRVDHPSVQQQIQERFKARLRRCRGQITAVIACRPSNANTSGMLRLFVYGTLKRGFWNHDRFCRGVLTVEDAVVQGCLYETPSGIPVLQVPEAHILAHGTTDPLADTATCLRAGTHRQARARFSEQLASYPEPARSPACPPLVPPWLEERRRIDWLEGFHPGGPCLYRRVLIPVQVNGGVLPAWLYVAYLTVNRGLRPLPSGKWRS